MNSRKKRIYSLLSSALIFSSLGFVSGMENNDDAKQEKQDIKQTNLLDKQTDSIENKDEPLEFKYRLYLGSKYDKLLGKPAVKEIKIPIIELMSNEQIITNAKQAMKENIKQTKMLGKKKNSEENQKPVSLYELFRATSTKGHLPKMLPDATPEDTTMVRLLTITNYLMRNICNNKPFISKLTRNHYRNSIKEEYAKRLRENLKSFIASSSNQKYVELWYEGLCNDHNDEDNDEDAISKLKTNLNEDEKKLLSFLFFCEVNISNQRLVDEKRNNLSTTARKLGFETQKIINSAIQNVLKSFAPTQRQQSGKLVNWEDGIVNGTKCEFTIFEDEDNKNNSLVLEENE